MDKLKKDFFQYPITISLIAFVCFVYIVSFFLYGETMSGVDALSFGGYNPLYVLLNHEYYRFITANFIHFGLLHLVMNCYSLYGIGRFVEASLKTKYYCIVIVVSALTTTFLPYCAFLMFGVGAYSVSGGISGVIFGLIGSIGSLAVVYRSIFLDVWKQLSSNLLLMLVISFVVPSISWSGHIGGMIGGFLTTLVITYIRKCKQKNYFVN